jgi:hypothetical protein
MFKNVAYLASLPEAIEYAQCDLGSRKFDIMTAVNVQDIGDRRRRSGEEAASAG